MCFVGGFCFSSGSIKPHNLLLSLPVKRGVNSSEDFSAVFALPALALSCRSSIHHTRGCCVWAYLSLCLFP